jgi:hypothetical protein
MKTFTLLFPDINRAASVDAIPLLLVQMQFICLSPVILSIEAMSNE